MAGRLISSEVSEYWKRLRTIRRRLDEQILSDGDESAFSSNLAMYTEVALRLKSLVQRHPQVGEKLLIELREKAAIKDAA